MKTLIRPWMAPFIVVFVLPLWDLHAGDLFGVALTIAALVLIMASRLLRCPAVHAPINDETERPHRCDRYRWHRGMHKITWQHTEQWIGPR